ncbi:hypothetical protein V1517DRAFT_272403 [Lipomyces orientalis]|uniref:Uncharacterized protein n=1 Tax=Lipomyces orientalis TaxID=1233043 RepID=A0ACC3TT29_9ASCO
MQTDSSNGTQGTIAVLRNFLMSRYNPQVQLLDLQNLYGDQYLLSNGLLSQDSTRSKMFPAMMKVASMDLKNVESVNMAGNNISDVTAVTTLAATFPQLKNLSLANNDISQWRHLDPWRHRFREMRELVLTGNPITGLNNYRAEILRRFPSLKMLDGEIIEGINVPEFKIRGSSPAVNSFAANIKKLPVSTKAGFFETTEIQNIVMDFLGKFFQVYDTDRSQLMPLYDNLSLFSLSLNTGVPRDLSARDNQGIQNWSSYIPISRNLTRVTTSNTRQNRLALGQDQILQLLRKIPPSKHDLSAPEKFAIEAWTARGLRAPEDAGIMLIVHGEFEEPPQQPGRANAYPLKRSFDRTLLLLPAPATGAILVVSDLLTVRGWAGSRAWTPR